MTTSKLKFNQWIASKSAKETQALGKRLGQQLERSACLMLSGELGAGKTTFVKGLAQGLGIRVDVSEVVSPTFVIMHEYPCRLPLYHIDLYRLDRVQGEDQALIMDAVRSEGVIAIEWAERAKDLYPRAYLKIELKHSEPNKRKIRLQPKGGFKLKS